MCARFCRHCGAAVATNANFCGNCGITLGTIKGKDESPVEHQKPQLVFDTSSKGVDKVPEWNTYYPSLYDTNGNQIASDEQIEFYSFWKDNLEKGIALDIQGNLSYIFVYAYDAIFRFVENKDFHALSESFGRLQKYNNYDTVAHYLSAWRADALLCLNDYEAAWQILRKAPKLRVEDVLNIRGRGSDASIDGHDLLGIIGKSGLTKYGREHRDEVASCVSIYLADFHQTNKQNFIAHFCETMNFSSLTEADVAKLETFFPKEDEFKRLKWEWEFEQRHPKPKRNETYLFSGVPFPLPTFPHFEIDEKKGLIKMTKDDSVRQPRMSSVELPKIVERALIYEIKRILRECEKTIKKEANKDSSRNGS